MRTDTEIYLTFDDGPDPEWTPRVLDLLAATRTRASFFVIGLNARHSPALVRRAAAEGHTIGNHTFSHRHPWIMSADEARREVMNGTHAIAEILGQLPLFYRPPHGRARRCMTEAAAACGQMQVLWDHSAVDWGPLGSATRIDKRLARVVPGEIVLMHDSVNRHNRPDQLLEVLPRFIANMQHRGVRAIALPLQPLN
jgi:peptidoglycan-N-acetylglucosamine deacetylase